MYDGLALDPWPCHVTGRQGSHDGSNALKVGHSDLGTVVNVIEAHSGGHGGKE